MKDDNVWWALDSVEENVYRKIFKKINEHI